MSVAPSVVRRLNARMTLVLTPTWACLKRRETQGLISHTSSTARVMSRLASALAPSAFVPLRVRAAHAGEASAACWLASSLPDMSTFTRTRRPAAPLSAAVIEAAGRAVSLCLGTPNRIGRCPQAQQIAADRRCGSSCQPTLPVKPSDSLCHCSGTAPQASCTSPARPPEGICSTTAAAPGTGFRSRLQCLGSRPASRIALDGSANVGIGAGAILPRAQYVVPGLEMEFRRVRFAAVSANRGCGRRVLRSAGAAVDVEIMGAVWDQQLIDGSLKEAVRDIPRWRDCSGPLSCVIVSDGDLTTRPRVGSTSAPLRSRRKPMMIKLRMLLAST